MKFGPHYCGFFIHIQIYLTTMKTLQCICLKCSDNGNYTIIKAVVSTVVIQNCFIVTLQLVLARNFLDILFACYLYQSLLYELFC